MDLNTGEFTEPVFNGPVTQRFCPLHLISEWIKSGTKSKMVTVSIVLPSGVGPRQCSTRIVEGGRELELTVKWPVPLTDLSVMHKKWLNSRAADIIGVYHPKYIGFETALNALRNNECDNLHSATRISLPFPVQTNFGERFNLGWIDDSTRIVYVDLKAYEDNDSLLRDENSFELL